VAVSLEYLALLLVSVSVHPRLIHPPELHAVPNRLERTLLDTEQFVRSFLDAHDISVPMERGRLRKRLENLKAERTQKVVSGHLRLSPASVLRRSISIEA
jgi:hypothetical protein